MKYKIEFAGTPTQLELIKAMGSKNPIEARAAQQVFATLLAPTVDEVFQQAETTGLIYQDLPFTEDSDPSFPLELFTDVPEGYFTITSQNMPGGLPTNTVHQPIEEVKFTTYKLMGTISYLTKYARQTRLPVIAKAIERLLQEVLVKTQANAWMVVFAALAKAKTNNEGHVYSVTTPGALTLDDFNGLITYFKRLNRSWAGGTPVGGASRPTDAVVSPETMGKLRAMAWNPINTKGPNNTTIATPNSNGDGVTLPESQRAAIYNSAGVPEFFGIALTELLELGVNQPYNVLFESYMGSDTFTKIDKTGSESFDPATDDLMLVLDRTRDIAFRAIATDSDTGARFNLVPDDQFVTRSEKTSWIGYVQEGRMVLDTRGIAGLVI
ncbi:MAG: hypothetical protein HC836_12730 [Richelia sp. RM2_1_2]|nr:hypothetical protein [Richelia sp. RM2_1_2]